VLAGVQAHGSGAGAAEHAHGQDQEDQRAGVKAQQEGEAGRQAGGV